jgi:hypothetical protein
MAAEWKYTIGFTYQSGYSDVTDYYEDRLGVELDFKWPIGVNFSPYMIFEGGHMVTFDVGPITMIWAELSGSSSSDSIYHMDIPIGANYGYMFMRDGKVSPYVKVGARYRIALGDGPESSSIGPYGAVGLEFLKNRRVNLGVQVDYDGAEVEFESGVDWITSEAVEQTTITPGQVGVSFRLIF